MSGQITRKEIIEDEALKWGSVYAKTLEEAISKNKEFVDSIIALNTENVKLRRSENQNDYIKQKNEIKLLTDKSNASIREQLALEVSLEKIKKEKIQTSKSELDLEVKKAKSNAEITKLMVEEEKLSQQKLKTEKERLTVEKQLIDIENKKQQLKNVGISVSKSELDLLQKEEIIKKNKLKELQNEENKLKQLQETSKQNIAIWKEQNQLELALISTKKKNELVYESTNKSLVKERVLLAESNKEIKLEARNQLGLVGSYEKLNRARLEAQKRLAELLSAEQKNTKEIAKATIEFETLDARVKAVDEATKNYSKNIGNYQSAFSGLKGTLQDLIQAFGLVTGALTFGSILTDIFTVIREFDRQLIAVGKTANISGEDLKNFGREVVELGGKLNGISIQGLLSSAEVAGQLGVTGTENILKFSSAIEKLKLTSDIISDEQVGQFAKFIEVSQDSFDNADRLASVITKLGNELATTEAEVLANATEIQKGVSVYNASADAVLGLGAATSTLGNEAEVSASSIQKGFGVINNAIATGKNLEQVLKLTGLTQKELSKQFNADAAGTFVKFVAGLKKAKEEGQNLQVVLKSVELDEVRTFKTIGSLAANYEVLEKAMASARQEYIDNVALNKEVAAASESIDSIISDLKDKWQEYILTSNDANDGTKRIANSLKFLRDNLQSIISNVVKYGSILLVFLGVQKAVNFSIAAWTALKAAATAAQIRFAVATGIGTQSILAEAAALRAAAAAQGGLNVVMAATPWGIILAAIAAVVVAYQVFNDELSETEARVNAVRNAQENEREKESFYEAERTKNREIALKGIEDEIRLRKAKGENSDKLDKEEIKSKVEVIQAQIALIKYLNEEENKRTKQKIADSNTIVAQLQKEFDETNKFALRNPFAESVKDKESKLINKKAELDALKATLNESSNLTVAETKKLQKLIDDLQKNNNVKDAEIQAEIDKKALAAARKRAKELYELEKKRLEDAYRLGQFRLQVAIDLDNEILNNEQASFQDRIDALLDFQQLSDAKIRETAEFELKNLGVYNEEKRKFIRELSDFQISEIIRTGSTSKKLTDAQQLIYERYQNGLTQIAKKGESERLKLIDNQVAILQKSIDAENQTRDTAYNDRITEENNLYARTLEIAKNNYELIEQATAEHERRLLKITQGANKEKLQFQINAMQTLLDENAKLPVAEQISADKRAEIENKLSQYRKELSEIDITTAQLTNEKKLQYENDYYEGFKAIKERERELAANIAYSLIDLANSIFDARVANIDAEIQRWNDYYDGQIEAAGNDARQKELLEKEKEKKTKQLEKERKKELIKAAIFNKILSIAQIGLDLAKTITAINLAAAQMDALAAFLFGGAGAAHRGIQIPLAIGLAAAQTATVLATPLQKYKFGRKDGPAEWAWTGDGYRKEVVSDPDGSNPEVTPAFPTLTYLKEHQIVHKSEDDYKKFVRTSTLKQYDKTANEVRNFQFIQNDTGLNKEILQELKNNTKAVNKSKSTIILQNKIDLGHEIWKMGNTNWNRK